MEIEVFLLLILIGFIGFLINRNNLLILVIYLEFFVLGVFIGFNFYYLIGAIREMLVVFYLLIGVIEGVLGLSLLVIIIRNVGKDFIVIKYLI